MFMLMNVVHNPSPEQPVGARRQRKGMNPQGLERFREGAEGKSSLFSIVRWLPVFLQHATKDRLVKITIRATS